MMDGKFVQKSSLQSASRQTTKSKRKKGKVKKYVGKKEKRGTLIMMDGWEVCRAPHRRVVCSLQKGEQKTENRKQETEIGKQ